MNKNELAGIINQTKGTHPLVHCITNYVTVNDVANIILACGAAPVMADAAEEAADISEIADALYINIGTLCPRTVESMLLAGKAANRKGIPVVLDPVGAGASPFRTQTTIRLLKEIKFAAIRGNVSEIKTIASGSGSTRGVDASVDDVVTPENAGRMIAMMKTISAATGAVIAASGAIDVIADADNACLCRNGNQMLCRITGSGCMESGVVASFAGANPRKLFEAAAAAMSFVGLCGEIAAKNVLKEKRGTGTFRAYFLDAADTLTSEEFSEGCRLEQR